MGNLQGFDANNVEPQTGFEPLPIGDYSAIISASEMKATKSGEGEYLQLTLEVLDEAFKGRRLWVRMNLKNKNEVAVKIAQAELSAICRAVGVMTPSDSTQLHNIPFKIKVGMEKNKENGELQNKIKSYHPSSEAPHAAANVAAAITSTAPPWAKK